MARPRCTHAGPIDPRTGRRPCALGLYGGAVRKLVECRACEKWAAAGGSVGAPAEAPAPEPAVVQLSARLVKAVAAPIAAAAAEPCPHFAELSGPERVAAGKGHSRQWGRCRHPERPLGDLVCPCNGCNSTCRGYTKDAVT